MPCDLGGLAACYFWRTHGYSPGEPEAAEDALAWEVYWKGQRLGLELVYRLWHLECLDGYSADWLLMRLSALRDAVQHQAQTAAQAE